MINFNSNEIEKKWQNYWKENDINKTNNDFSNNKKKFYILDMFPYPSGEGLHVGHPKGYIATDIYSRMKKMQGYNVLHPMGFDAFGLPAEQFAIKNKINPKIAVEKNIARYKEQLNILGLNYDWGREVNTTDPKFYKWTEWMWKQMYKDGLAFESFDPINWCPTCKTGLANEDLDGNTCERCGTVVEKKKLRQWTIRITDYADRLLNDLDKLNWEPHIKELQRNWIGKSEGSEIEFEIVDKKLNFVILHAFENSPETSFYSWLKTELEKRGHLVNIPNLPESNDPKVYDQVDFVLQNIKFDNNTVIIGHSLGGVVALKVLEKLSNPIKKTILVGSYLENNFIDENFPEYTFDWNFDFNKIKSNSKEFILLRDIEDNLVPQENTLKLSKSLNGKLIDVVASDPHFFGKEEIEVLNQSFDKLKIFTTRADTLFGCTFMAISYTLAKEWIENGWNASEEIKNFINKLEQEEKDRTIDFDMSKLEKEGIDTGIKAINPVNGEEVPIYIANYILSDYGTGAIMAVPAHDERDYEFAKKYNLEIREVIAIPAKEIPDGALERRDATVSIVEDNNKFLVLSTKENKFLFPQGGIEESDINIIESAKREIKEESGYVDVSLVRQVVVTENYFDMGDRGIRHRLSFVNHFKLNSEEKITQKREEYLDEDFIINWFSKEEVLEKLNTRNHKEIFEFFIENKIYIDEGILVNSQDFSGMNSEEARVKITEKVGGKIVSKYKLKDWVFARQRYWGEPFPIVFIEDENGNRKSYAVADKELPVILPNVENYEPTDNGESPLANIKDWVEVYGFINDDGEFESLSGTYSEREIKTINTYKENFETYISETVQEISGEWKEESDFLAEKLKGKRVLEIGSASGRDAIYLKNKGVDIIASDIVDSFSKITEEKGLEFLNIDPLLDNFYKEKYDGILSIASLLHSEKYNFEKILTKINLALNDNGHLYLRLKNGEGELEEERKGGYRFFSFFNENELRNILTKLEFEIEKISYLENDKWINIFAKKIKTIEVKKFYRETNTMPQWAGSSWYYLRYIDTKNENEFVNKELEKIWSPVDFYVGGAEHATRHLIYARFWHKYLFDKGLVNYDEPFNKLQTVGLIMAEDGKKMSKRYGNVVNPDDIIREYGADTLRTYEMFMGPFEKAINWNTDSIIGVYRFLGRVYNLIEKIELEKEIEDNKEIERVINETIKKVGEDIEEFKFNTAIAQMMICLNSFEEETKKGNKISKKTFSDFIQVLSPFAIHICEEIWQNVLGNNSSIHLSNWPKVDVTKITKEEIEMSLQINGKFKGNFIIKKDKNDEELKEGIKELEIYKKYIADINQIKKIIIVKNKLINIVI